jgi:short-subunit dehydrogenase
MTDLQGAHVLVVGATGGLGSEIARRLAAAGAALTLSGRRADALDALAAELRSAVIRTVAADLTLPGSPDEIVRRATEERPLDGIVYAAGTVAFGSVLDLDDDVLDELLLTNFIAAVRLARAALPGLEAGSFLVHLSAIVAEQPTAGMAAYSAAKAALTAFDRAAATELRRRGVRMIDVRPPHTETGLADRSISGTSPRLPRGLDARTVADRVVTAITADERDLPAALFT